MRPSFDVRWQLAADRSGGPSACWEWRRRRNEGRYGRIRYGGRNWYAHRLAFFLANGCLPEAVCHRCDNPPCVNPAHLRAGTFADNTEEMWAKGRGGSAANAKLTPAQVAYIRNRFTGGRRAAEALGVQMGVSGRTIYRLFTAHPPKCYAQPQERAA